MINHLAFTNIIPPPTINSILALNPKTRQLFYDF